MKIKYQLNQLKEISLKVTQNFNHKIVLISGEMGAGKTTLIKQILIGLNVIDNITSKELIIDSNSEVFYNKEEIIEILNNGKVIFNKSEPNKEPCGMYYIKSGDFNVDVINCENEATIMIN